MNAKQGLTVVIIILLLLLLGVGYWGFKANNEKADLAAQNQLLTEQFGSLSTLKDNLQKEVDSLQLAYASLAEENESLKGSAAEAAAAKRKVAEKEAIIKKISAQSSAEVNNLKAQIEQLLAVRNELQESINTLQTENDSLRELTGKLTADLAASESEKADLAALNQTIQEELKKLTLANFKATAFQVEVERKKPKATAKSGKARRIIVSFDLTGVAAEYRGIRPLYLVITDDKGTPIKTNNPIQAKLTVNGQEQDIIAVQQKEINVKASQRLGFTHELEDKLRSGYYRVSVYTDIGMLGAASFRLQ